MEKNNMLLSRGHLSILKSIASPVDFLSKKTSSAALNADPYKKSERSFFYENKVRENKPSFRVPLDPKDQDRYRNSFLKKRMLHIWKKQRPLVHAAAKLPETLEITILKSAYRELEPILMSCYKEDFSFPFIPFSFFGWLQYVKLTAQITERQQEAALWQELSQFFQQCHQHQLLNDLFVEVKD
jgi:hypothetical protein